MPDLIPPEAIAKLLDWFLWVAIALGVGLVVVSLVLMAFGRSSVKLLLSGLVAVALGVTLNQIFTAVTEGLSFEEPYGFVSVVIVAVLLVMSAFYFAFGNPERGSKTILAAVLAAGFFAMIPVLQAVFTGPGTEFTGSCIVLLEDMSTSGLQFSGDVRMAYGSGTFNVDINYGDGAVESATLSQGGVHHFTHTYGEAGSYPITVTASNGVQECSVVSAVSVEPPTPWLAPKTEMPGVILGLGTIPLTYYYIVPEFDLKEGSYDWKTYSITTSVAIGALALMISLRMITGFLGRHPEESVPETLKETMIVLAAILLAPYLYQVFAVLCNRISEIPLKNIDITSLFAGAATLISVSLALGTFSSFFGFLGGFLATGLIISNLSALVRIFMIKAIILIFPFLAILYLFHVTRGPAQFVLSVGIGLAIAGPVAAFVLAGLASQTGLLAGLIAPVFAYVLFPYLLTMSGGGVASTVGQGIARFGVGSAAGVARSLGRGSPPGGSLNSPGSGMETNSRTDTNGGTVGSKVLITPSWAGKTSNTPALSAETTTPKTSSTPIPSAEPTTPKTQASGIDTRVPVSPTSETSPKATSIAGIPKPKLTLKERFQLGFYNFRERIELKKISLMSKVDRAIPQEVKTFLGHFRDGMEAGAVAWSIHTNKPARKRVKGDPIEELRTKRGEVYWKIMDRHLKQMQSTNADSSSTVTQPDPQREGEPDKMTLQENTENSELEGRAFLEKGRSRLESMHKATSDTPKEGGDRL